MALVSDAIFSLLVLGCGLLAASTIGLTVALIRTRERAIRAEQRLAPSTGEDGRFDRMEQAVEAMALEVERMSEGQRFVSRLLAERPAREAGAPTAHAVAPR